MAFGSYQKNAAFWFAKSEKIDTETYKNGIFFFDGFQNRWIRVRLHFGRHLGDLRVIGGQKQATGSKG